MDTKQTQTIRDETNGLETSALLKSRAVESVTSKPLTLKRLRGGLLFIVGYLLSPLSWWNDLIFNLPVAYGVGYVCSLISGSWLLPGLIVGYWLSNVLGIVMMQFGAVDALHSQPKPRNIKKEIFMGVASSTVYTLIVLALVQFKVIDPTALVPGELFNLGALLPGLLGQGAG